MVHTGRTTTSRKFPTGPGRAADAEGNFVADVADYVAAGGPAPTNRAERRELARRLTRRKGRGFTR